MSSAPSSDEFAETTGRPVPLARAARTIEEVESLRETWDQLKECRPSASLFSDIDFFLSGVAAEGDRVRPHVISLNHPEAGALLIAGTIRRIRFTPTVGYLKLRLFRKPRHCLYVPPGGLLGAAEGDGAAALITTRLLRELQDPGIDWVYLSHLPLDSNLARLVRTAPGLLVRARFPTLSTNFTMSIPNDPALFFAARSKNHRKNLRKLLNRLERDFAGKVHVSCVRKSDDVDSFCRKAETIANTTYQRAMDVGFVDSPGERERLRTAARRGMLRSYLLTVEGKPVSFLCGLQCGGTFFAENIGYVRDMERYRVGTFLFVRIVEDLCTDEGIVRLDFGSGTGTWKERYADDRSRDISIRIFSPGFTGAAMNITRSLAELLTRLGLKVSQGTGLYGWLKKRWRNLLGREAAGSEKGACLRGGLSGENGRRCR